MPAHRGRTFEVGTSYNRQRNSTLRPLHSNASTLRMPAHQCNVSPCQPAELIALSSYNCTDVSRIWCLDCDCARIWELEAGFKYRWFKNFQTPASVQLHMAMSQYLQSICKLRYVILFFLVNLKMWCDHLYSWNSFLICYLLRQPVLWSVFRLGWRQSEID